MALGASLRDRHTTWARTEYCPTGSRFTCPVIGRCRRTRSTWRGTARTAFKGREKGAYSTGIEEWPGHLPVTPFTGRALVAAALLTLAAGCGGRGDVSGKVTYQGKALVWGTVQFEGRDGALVQGNINPDFTYLVRGVATGQAKVGVSSINPSSTDFQLRVAPGQ